MPVNVKAIVKAHVKKTSGCTHITELPGVLEKERLRIADLSASELLREFNVSELDLPKQEHPREKPNDREWRDIDFKNSKAEYFREKLILSLHGEEIKARKKLVLFKRHAPEELGYSSAVGMFSRGAVVEASNHQSQQGPSLQPLK